MARYVVTGGAGFIGSHLARALVAKKLPVVIIDNFSTSDGSSLNDLVGRIRIIKEDVRDYAAMRRLLQPGDVIFHLAAMPSVTRSLDDPLGTMDVNVQGTISVLKAAADAGVAKVVYATSSSVYGDTPVLPQREDFPPRPLSPYAVSKYTGEQLLRVFARVYGLATVGLRYFNVFGPGQKSDPGTGAVIPQFINFMLQGKQPVIYGDGRQTRDFVYVSDVVNANLLAAAAPVGDGSVFNIARQEQHSLNELVQVLQDIIGVKLPPVYRAERPGEIRHSCADITAARRRLGYRPEVGFAEGLRRTVHWFRSSIGGQ